MSPEERKWLDTRFKSIEKAIENVAEKIKDITDPIRDDITRHGLALDTLFSRIGEVETKVAILRDNKKDKKDNKATIIAVVSVGIAIIAIIVGAV